MLRFASAGSGERRRPRRKDCEVTRNELGDSSMSSAVVIGVLKVCISPPGNMTFAADDEDLVSDDGMLVTAQEA